MMLGDLVSMDKTNKKNNEVLLVIVFFKEYELLSEHLSLLSKQTSDRFDIIIVIDPVSDSAKVKEVVAKSGIDQRVAIAKMNEPKGAAGAFFCGDKFALENDYKAVIYADIDAFPVDQNVIEKMLKEYKSGSLLVTPRCELPFMGHVLEVGRGGGHYYGLVDSSLLRKHGLHFTPMFIGGDDVEFYNRVCSRDKMEIVDAKITHPLAQSIFANFERSALYRINIATIAPTPSGYVNLFLFVLLPYILFGTKRTRRVAFHIIRALIVGRFGEKVILQPLKISEQTPKFDLAIGPFEIEGKKTFVLDYLKPGKGRILEMLIACIGKKVLIYPVKNYVVGMVMIFASEAWVQSKNESFEIAKNGIIIHIIRIILFFPFFFFSLFMMLIAYLAALIRKPKTEGYGLV